MTQDIFLKIYGAKPVLYKLLASIELKHLHYSKEYWIRFKLYVRSITFIMENHLKIEFYLLS